LALFSSWTHMQPTGPAAPGFSLHPQPGDVLLGKYRVEKVIGVGGMGAVVSARHLQLEERVAIKFLLPEMLQHDEIVQRFLREARSAIKIRSEHCVRVLDVGKLETGAPYMVMEYLEGQDLAAIVGANRHLPIADVIDWVLQACEALAEAHVLGIVHRDLKPANLFLTRRADGTPSVKVLDFGISKQATSGADAGVTKTQAVLGSPRYMSPEQMRSTKDVDARADVWALGAVVHELVAGDPPFDAETMTALCAAILQDPPRPIRSSRIDVPPQLEAVLRGALEKDRDRRFQNVAQFAAALAPFGSVASRASAERIARVLGVAAPLPMDPRASAPAFPGPSPMAATTGRSGSITSDVAHKPSGGAAIVVSVVAFLLFAVVGTVGLVVSKRHAPDAAPASGPQSTASAAASPPAPPSAPQAPSPTPSVVLAEPSAAPPPLPSANAVPSSKPAAVPAGVPGVVPAHRPGAAPPTQKPPSNNNPFGDDRRG
jgi:eukaryotic-like serine/threonine-protein kinase